MYIRLEYNLDQYILIKLFDNSATTKWFDKFSKYKLGNATVNKDFNNYDWLKKTKDQRIDQITHHWDNIKLALNKLTNIGFKVPFAISGEFDYDQNILNKLHRFFTYNASWYHDNLHNLKKYENPFDPDFKIEFQNFKDWHGIIDEINKSVHYLENYTNPPNREILNTYPLKTIAVNINPQTTFDTWINFNTAEQQENYRYQEYNSLGKPLVILDNCILGKSYLQSFLENDDPTCEDCTGREGTHGNFLIELTDNRSKIYNSQEFKNWLSLYNIENPPLEFPIGFVVDYDIESLNSISFDLKITDIVFLKSWPG